MRHTAWAAIVGIIAVQVGSAQPPAAYNPPAGFPGAQPGYMPYSGQYWGNAPVANNGFSRAMSGSCGTGADCGGTSSGRSGDRIGRLIDFLLYRPTQGCDCCPQVTPYVPPLHAWFPACCHANGGNGCNACGVSAGCSKCGFRNRQGSGCATCEGVAGTPVRSAAVKAEVVESKSTAMPARQVSFAPPSNNTQRQPIVAVPAPAPTTRYWMPGIQTNRPVNGMQPQQYQNQSNNGYGIQPSNYLPPLPQQQR